MLRKFVFFWKTFKDYDIGIKQVFADLGKQAVLEDNIVSQLEHYVRLLYQTETTLATVNKLWWWIFRRKQGETERLPPTMQIFIFLSFYECSVDQNLIIIRGE